MIAHVVPLRRLPTERSWFDYRLPEELVAPPGSVVQVPFGRQLVNAVVWAVDAETDQANLKDVAGVIIAEPYVTPWLRQALNTLAAEYFVSLGTLLASAVPAVLKRQKADEPMVLDAQQIRGESSSHYERVWWYRDRQQCLRDELTWLLKDDALRAICFPTIEDVTEAVQALGPEAGSVAVVHSQITERDYRRLYDAVRRGHIKKIMGTGRVFFLPYPEEPGFLLDQEEHPAHRQTEQHPRFDNRQTVFCLRPQAILTSPAPSIATMRARRPSPPSFQGTRQLVPLGQPGSRDWLTPDAEALITTALGQGQHIWAIVPHAGFAQRLACKECGWTLDCPQCKQRVRLAHHHGTSADCQACGASVKVPTQCPRCQSTRWALSGLGVEQFMQTLRRRWPQVTVTAPEAVSATQPSVIVGTYQSHRQRRQSGIRGPVLIVSGDALLSYPDFSVSERAWAYIARIQADQPESPVIIQTYEPELPFWQRWRHGDDRTWYEDELTQREQQALPPYAQQWIVYCPGADQKTLEAKQHEVASMLPPNITLSVLSAPTQRRFQRTAGRLLLQAKVGIDLRAALDWPSIFPSPWQIDTAIRGWSE